MEDSFVSAVVILLLVTDPIGNIPLFVSLLRDVDPDRRVRVIVRECAIALAVLLVCVPFGSSLLALFGLSEWLLAVTVAVAACLVVLVFAEHISRWVGEGVLTAFERLMGLLLTAIAVEMLLRGIEGFVRHLQSG